MEALYFVFWYKNIACGIDSRYSERQKRHPPFDIKRYIYCPRYYKNGGYYADEHLRVVWKYVLIDAFLRKLEIIERIGIFDLLKSYRSADIQNLRTKIGIYTVIRIWDSHIQ